MRFTILSLLFLTILSAQEKAYFQQHVNYDIQVLLNDNDHTISAYEKLTYQNNSPDTLNFIWFHIWPNAYKDDSTAYAKQAGVDSRFSQSDSTQRGFIDSLDFSIDGKKVDWVNHPDWIDVIKLRLPTPLMPNKSIRIETPFFVKIPEVFSRLGHTGKHYEMTQWYPKPAVYDRKGWHPMPYLNQGEFYSEFGSFDVKITLPKDYRIMATGDLVNGEDEYAWLDSLTLVADSIQSLPKKDFKKWVKSQKKNNKETDIDSTDIEMKTLHFHQEKVHDFAWFADKKWLVQKGELYLADSTQKVTLWSFYLPKNAKLWENSIEYLHDSGYWYSRYYGDYPYNHITAVDGDLSAGGGMEYPNITVISKMPGKQMLEMVIMHEVGHNWFYGILGSNERYHTWMDEGFNDYTNIRYWQDKYKDQDERFVVVDFIQNKLGIGRNMKFSWFEYIRYAATAKSPKAQPLNLKADEFIDGNYGQNYSKTAVFTRFLQHYLGEEKMDEIMQDYYETWKFKHPYPEDVQTIFEKHYGKDLRWYFDGVFETTDYVDFSIQRKGNRFTVSNKGKLKTPVEVVFFGNNHEELERRWLEDFEWRTVINAPVNVWYAIIDPDEHMPDVDRTNNATRAETHFHFVWDQPTYYDRDINYLPWLFSYNYYNGWSPGLMMYKGGSPGYNSTTSIQTMWDFKNEKIIGNIAHIKKLDPNLKFKKANLIFRGSQMEGRTLGAISYTGSFGESESGGSMFSGIQYAHLDSAAFDSTLYTTGTHPIIELGFSQNWHPKGEKYSLNTNTEIKFGDGFSTASFETKIKLKFTKKLKLGIRIWSGGFINNKKVPNHFRSYLSGGVDPTFSSLIFDRTGQSQMAIIQNQYLQQGPGLRGVVMDEKGIPLASTGFTWGVNVDPSFPIFIDIAGGDEFKDSYTVAGLKFGPIILPLYQSWEMEGKTAENWIWVKDRMRFTFNFDLGQLARFSF
ncbi:MAG: M1 family metallopeptidase [Candidatus Marinimicrobia bacterium]|nr:M1 family metallopeptidase [Candidatus Neomarinimicrobiota bacterium]